MEHTGEPAMPQTRAGEVVAKWLAAFNSEEPERVRALSSSYEDAPPPDQMLALREMTGGFTVLRIEDSRPLSLTVLLREKDGDAIGKLAVSISEGDPVRITKLELRAVPRPPEFAIPRMSETDALAATVTAGAHPA